MRLRRGQRSDEPRSPKQPLSRRRVDRTGGDVEAPVRPANLTMAAFAMAVPRQVALRDGDASHGTRCRTGTEAPVAVTFRITKCSAGTPATCDFKTTSRRRRQTRTTALRRLSPHWRESRPTAGWRVISDPRGHTRLHDQLDGARSPTDDSCGTEAGRPRSPRRTAGEVQADDGVTFKSKTVRSRGPWHRPQWMFRTTPVFNSRVPRPPPRLRSPTRAPRAPAPPALS